MVDQDQHVTVVTGGAGFLGSNLCRRLVAEGKQVVCIDNLFTGSRYNLRDILDNDKFNLVVHDISVRHSNRCEWSVCVTVAPTNLGWCHCPQRWWVSSFMLSNLYVMMYRHFMHNLQLVAHLKISDINMIACVERSPSC